ncbi:hypothetical protein A3715_00120 [Oleiphilus sp. HI0009]|nr:hypothetical protein A3715_00120 [Oleiphilus sp. HI0009]
MVSACTQEAHATAAASASTSELLVFVLLIAVIALCCLKTAGGGGYAINQGPRNKFKTGKLQIAEFNIDDIKRPLKWNYYGLIDKDCYQLNASLSSESTTVTSCLSGHLMSSRDGDVWSNILPEAPTREEIDTFLLEQRIPKRLITEFNLNPPLIIPVVAP